MSAASLNVDGSEDGEIDQRWQVVASSLVEATCQPLEEEDTDEEDPFDSWMKRMGEIEQN